MECVWVLGGVHRKEGGEQTCEVKGGVREREGGGHGRDLGGRGGRGTGTWTWTRTSREGEKETESQGEGYGKVETSETRAGSLQTFTERGEGDTSPIHPIHNRLAC